MIVSVIIPYLSLNEKFVRLFIRKKFCIFVAAALPPFRSWDHYNQKFGQCYYNFTDIA